MTTPTLHQAAQVALDALDYLGDSSDYHVSPDAWEKAKAEAACTALREALAQPQAEPVPEPYLCIAPACGTDCSICNQALSLQEVRNYAIGYAILRNAPIDAIKSGGVFAGRTPDNVVINGADLDAATFGAAAQQSIDQQVEPINGGAVQIDFRVSSAADITEKILGRTAIMMGDDVEITLEPPVVEVEKPAPAQIAPAVQQTPESIFMESAEPEAVATAGDEGGWPFPNDPPGTVQ